jgi:hypothetical protein
MVNWVDWTAKLSGPFLTARFRTWMIKFSASCESMDGIAVPATHEPVSYLAHGSPASTPDVQLREPLVESSEPGSDSLASAASVRLV